MSAGTQIGYQPAAKEQARDLVARGARSGAGVRGVFGKSVTYLVLFGGAVLLLFPFAFMVSSSQIGRAHV